MTTSKRVVFFGNERLVSGLKHTDTPILRGLIERGYEIVAIVASHSDARLRTAQLQFRGGRGRKGARYPASPASKARRYRNRAS